MHRALERRDDQVSRRAERPVVHVALPALSGAVTFHHVGTSRHCERVAENSCRIGERLGIDESGLDGLRWAGLLHDLGKIGISAGLLDKPGVLSPEERAIVQRHSDIGADLVLSLSPDLAPLSDIVRFHHERWDGSGYPQGLAGTMIPVGARIIAVTDVFDAMTEGRPYHDLPPSPERALLELRTGSGVRYDATVVHLFTSLFADGLVERP